MTAAIPARAAGRLAALALLLSAPLAAAVAPRVDDVPTRLTKGPVRTTVLLPPSYASSPERRYPVLYFLHDGYGNERTLFTHGVADALVEEMRAGRIPELLVVSPRIVGTWCVDSYDGTRRTASFLAKELVPFVDASYRTVPERRARGVAGISMGGYGAILWAMREPDLFAAAGGVSAALQQMSWETLQPLPPLVRLSFTRIFGKSELKNSLRENDVYDLLLREPSLAARAPHVSLRCGTEDRYRLAQFATFFGRFLDALGVANDVTVEPGAHDWKYWARSLPPLLAAVASRLSGGTP